MLLKYWLNYSAEAHSEATYQFHPLSYLHVLPVSKPCVVFPEVIVRIYFLLFIHSVMPGFNCGTLDLWFSLWHANCKILVAACGIPSPEQELNKGPLHWECCLSHWTTSEVTTVRMLNHQCSLGTNQAASELESWRTPPGVDMNFSEGGVGGTGKEHQGRRTWGWNSGIY